MKNDIETPLDKTQKSALMALARSINMVHVGDGIHSHALSRYYPTKYGWEPVVRINWKHEYRDLEKKYDNVQGVLAAYKKEVQDLRDVIHADKGRKWMEKVLRIISSSTDSDECLKQIKRFLLDKEDYSKMNKKKGG